MELGVPCQTIQSTQDKEMFFCQVDPRRAVIVRGAVTEIEDFSAGKIKRLMAPGVVLLVY